MIGLPKLLSRALLTVTALLPSVAAAQVVPTSYSLDVGGLYHCFGEDGGGGSAYGSCWTIGCIPEVKFPEGDCIVSSGNGTAIVRSNRIELDLHINGDGWASQSLQFTVTADCCVTYNLPVGRPVDWHVSFLGAPYNEYRSGKINVPAGSYSVSLSAEFVNPNDSSIVLIFSYGFCDDDCDADGQLDWNQIAWGWAPDVNSNGVLDVCDLRGGDLNLDGVVGSADLTLLLDAWGGTLPEIIDLTGDGVVSTADLSFLFSKWNM